MICKAGVFDVDQYPGALVRFYLKDDTILELDPGSGQWSLVPGDAPSGVRAVTPQGPRG